MKNAWLEGKNIGKIPFLLILLLSSSLSFLLLSRNSKKPFDFLTAFIVLTPICIFSFELCCSLIPEIVASARTLLVCKGQNYNSNWVKLSGNLLIFFT